jgi:hypothetical protein
MHGASLVATSFFVLTCSTRSLSSGVASAPRSSGAMASRSSSLSLIAFSASFSPLFPVKNGGRKGKDEMPALHLPPPSLPPTPGAAASARPGALLRSLLRDDAGSWEEATTTTLGPGLAASGREDPGAHETEKAGAMARRDPAPPHGEAEGDGGSSSGIFACDCGGSRVIFNSRPARQSISRLFEWWIERAGAAARVPPDGGAGGGVRAPVQASANSTPRDHKFTVIRHPCSASWGLMNARKP